jgi:phage gp29-like protein
LNEWIYDEDTDTLMGMSQIPAPDYKERRIPLDKSIHFVTTSTKCNPEGRSTLRNARRSCYMKTNIEDLEGIGIERDLAGYPTLYIPLEVFKRDTDKAEEAYNDFMDVISNIRRDEAEGILLPAVFDANGNRLYEFKLLSSSGTRQFDTSRVINRYDTRIALTVMADFLLLGQQKQGSYALSDTKSKMFYQSLMSLLDNIAETINTQAVPELFELNGWERDEFPYLAHGKAEPVNLEVLGNFLGKLTDLGMELDDRLENHLRGIADMPLRDAKPSTSRSRSKPAQALRKPQQQKRPRPELLEDGCGAGEEVAA